MSHRGSILALPGGIHAWPVLSADDLTPAAFAPVVAECAAIRILLVGTGREAVFLPKAIREILREAGIGVDIMQTGAAARTYNILVAEDRPVAAALIAVD
jgi:uncharacterized protein